MAKRDKLYIGIYNDYYGGLLTGYQSEMIRAYYDEDLSLAEIAAAHGISPQGVRDILVRAEHALLAYEDKLRMVERTQKTLAELTALRAEEQDSSRRQRLDALMEIWK